MPIRFACSLCKKVYKAPDEYAGKRTACKRCGAVLAIPTGESSDSLSSKSDDKVTSRVEATGTDSLGPTTDPASPSPPEDAVEIEYVEEGLSDSVPSEAVEDYIPVRRRKRRSISGIGLILVAGLGLLVVVAVIAVALKKQRSEEYAEKRTRAKTTDKAAIGFRADTPELVSKSTDHGQETAERASTGGDLLGFVCILTGLAAVIAVVTILVWRVDVCPRCGRWRAVRCVGSRVKKQKKCFGIVTRRGQATRAGTIYTPKHSIPTVSYEQSSWEERVPVIRTTYENTMRCKFCGQTWTEEEHDEVEDFDPDAPLDGPSAES